MVQKKMDEKEKHLPEKTEKTRKRRTREKLDVEKRKRVGEEKIGGVWYGVRQRQKKKK